MSCKPVSCFGTFFKTDHFWGFRFRTAAAERKVLHGSRPRRPRAGAPPSVTLWELARLFPFWGAFLPFGSTVLCQRQIEQSGTGDSSPTPRLSKGRAKEEGLVCLAASCPPQAPLCFLHQKRRSTSFCVDPARFQSLRTRSREVMEIFSWCTIFEKFKNIFQCVPEK